MKNFKIYVKIENNWTSKIHDITKQDAIFLDEEEVLEISYMSKKQLNLYLLRHKEIKKIKDWNKKLISIKILKHVFKNIKRINNKINLNNYK